MRLIDRRRALMQSPNSALPDTNPELIYTPNKYLGRFADLTDMNGCGVTDYLPVVKNNTFTYYNPISNLASDSGQLGFVIVYNNVKGMKDYWNCRANGTVRSLTCATDSGNGYVQLNIPMDGIKDCYAYNNTTGVIYYAGINTPYYGKTNIND